MSLAWEIRQSSGLKLIIHVLSECRGPSPFFAHVNSQDFGSQRAALSFRLQMWSVLACCVPSRSVVSDSLPPHGLQPARLPRPWGPPGKHSGVGCPALLHGIFQTRDQTCVSHASRIGSWALYHWHHLKSLLLSCFSRVRLCVTPQTAAHQAPLSLGFSRQEHWSGLPFPSPKSLSHLLIGLSPYY